MRTINVAGLFLNPILFRNSGSTELKVVLTVPKRLTMRKLAAASNNEPYLGSLSLREGLDVVRWGLMKGKAFYQIT
jgi:hypothetical protein